MLSSESKEDVRLEEDSVSDPDFFAKRPAAAADRLLALP